jgi:hypothetical protein
MHVLTTAPFSPQVSFASWPASAEAKELCSALLRKDPAERLTIEQVSASVMATDDH